jgi:hypothetical protein
MTRPELVQLADYLLPADTRPHLLQQCRSACHRIPAVKSANKAEAAPANINKTEAPAKPKEEVKQMNAKPAAFHWISRQRSAYNR